AWESRTLPSFYLPRPVKQRLTGLFYSPKTLFFCSIPRCGMAGGHVLQSGIDLEVFTQANALDFAHQEEDEDDDQDYSQES
ncbi:MAG: hypothetical protein ACOYKZ_00915, partial [Chlamydiia bacterium]